MTDINDLFPSKYLKAADAEPEVTLTIARVSKESMKNKEGKDELKPVIFFQELEKGMVLNKTNAATLTAMYTSTIENWTGQKVVLCAAEVSAFGEMQKALRFRQEAPTVSRTDLLKRYGKLFEEAKKLAVENIETYVLSADASEASIIEIGKELRSKVDAAKQF
jgi:ethanolamine ammonia-lyase large subunit